MLGADELAVALAPVTKGLKGVDRYLRRALSRRKFAMRDFAAAQGQDAGGLQGLGGDAGAAEAPPAMALKIPSPLGGRAAFYG